MEFLEGAVVPPLIEVAPDGALGRKILGEEAPLATRAQDVENGIHNVTHRGFARTAARVHGDEWLNERPLRVGQVARVMLDLHTLLYAAVQLQTPLSDSLLALSFKLSAKPDFLSG